MTLPNNVTTRYPNGVNNETLTSLFVNMGQPNPLLYSSYLTDFMSYSSADWVATATGGATEALTAGDGGLLLITNTAGNNDVVGVQKTPAMFAFDATKSAWFKARLKVSDATKSQVIIGLQIVNVDATTATDGIYFNKALASTSVDFICRKNTTTGSETTLAVGTMADDTYMDFGWYYDAEALRVDFAINGAFVGSMDASSSFLPDATNLAPIMFLKNGEAVAKTMTVDYVYLIRRR